MSTPLSADTESVMVDMASALICMMVGSLQSEGREAFRLSMALFRSE